MFFNFSAHRTPTLRTDQNVEKKKKKDNTRRISSWLNENNTIQQQ
jgi:hypothetical protein